MAYFEFKHEITPVSKDLDKFLFRFRDDKENLRTSLLRSFYNNCHHKRDLLSELSSASYQRNYQYLEKNSLEHQKYLQVISKVIKNLMSAKNFKVNLTLH